jgi:aspartyl protease family protein
MLPDNPDDQARFFYLLFLLLGLGFFFLSGRGRQLGRGLRDLALWGLIFLMVVIAYGFRDTLRSQLFPASMVALEDGTIELRRGADGHFHASLEINGQPLRFLVDTGASGIVLARDDAAAVGIDPDRLNYVGRATTANGTVATAPVRLGLVRLGEMTDTNVRAHVSGGGLDVSLLGMSYLDRFARIEIEGDTMRLHP